MKKLPRKSASQPRYLTKTSTISSAEHEATLLRLQLCFFLSGAAGLIDQVVWTKALGQLFGYSAYAVATVLAVFMGGLALGSALFARWRPLRKNGVALYAWLEFSIAASALLSLPGIAFTRQIYLGVYPYVGGSPAILLALRFVAAAVVLAIPTILMGGTLPILLSAISREARDLGGRAGRFYAGNTAGAVVGTIAAGFFLIPWIGLRLTLLTAVVLNVIAGFLASKLPQLFITADIATQRLQNKKLEVPAKSSMLHLICFAVVGATAITYELSWTRLLATPLGSSTYAFTLMLATFLLGIAIGSSLFERWYRKRRSATVGLFAATQLAIAAAVLFSLWVYREIPDVLLYILRNFGQQFSSLLAAQVVTCGLALLPATILFGFNFPAVLALICESNSESNPAGDEFHLSSGVGRAVAANTFAAILAAIVGGFLLLPWIGSFRLSALAATINMILAIVLFLSANRRNWKPIVLAAALLIAIGLTALSSTFFSRTTAAFGVVLYSSYRNPALTAGEMADTEDLVFFKEGVNATIAVTRSENYVALKTNGKVDASNLDSATQLLLGDLGAVFHPHPRKVLIIGFGGGMTASAVSRFPDVGRIDCVEIEPAVLEGAEHLERLNRDVLRDPRLHIHFDDARNFLQTTREHYDLIISEPSNPWIAGVASLYTEEFFAVVRAHLAQGGNFVQWIQAYGLEFDDLAMILAGLERQFPDLSLWHSSGRDFLVLARTISEPLSFDRSRALWNNALLREDFDALHLAQPESWPAYFRLDHSAIHTLSNHARKNTDDRTLLEYSAPESLLKDSLTSELGNKIDALETSPLPGDLSAQDAQLAATASAKTELEINAVRAAKFLSLLTPLPTDAEHQVLRARLEIAERQYGAAAKDLETLGTKKDNQFEAQYWLAIAQREQGLLTEAESTLDSLLANQPEHQAALAAKVSLSSQRKEWPAAVEAQIQLTQLRPGLAAERCNLGDLYLRANNLTEAEAPLLKGLQLDSYVFLCHRDLGELYRATGCIADAIKELEWVVRFFPEADPKTYLSLALANQAAGKHDAAVSALEKGRRLFPANALLQKFTLMKN